MTTRSQNGYSVEETSAGLLNPAVGAASIHFAPGVRPDESGQLLIEFARRFDQKVEALGVGCWGYNYRAVRGATDISNHASGTAIDINAPRHPLGATGTFSAAQVAAIHDLLAEFNHAIRWGGDYPGRKDEMHFEINGTWAEVLAALAKVTKPIPVKPVPVEEDVALTPDDIQKIAAAVWAYSIPVDDATQAEYGYANSAYQAASLLRGGDAQGRGARQAIKDLLAKLVTK